MRASSVEPTKSQNITVSWRRSASRLGAGTSEGGEEAAVVVKEWRPAPVGAELAPPSRVRPFTEGGASSAPTALLDHVALCQRLQLVNFEAGARLAGAGFPVLTGAGAMLQRALINFMLDVHIQRHGYTEVRPPFIVRLA